MVNRLSFRNLRIDNFKLITWLQIFIIAITPNFIFFNQLMLRPYLLKVGLLLNDLYKVLQRFMTGQKRSFKW